MKQTVEEASQRGAEGYNIETIYKLGFRDGAEWQAKQSPWISVKEKEPIINKPILAMLGGKVVIITLSGWDSNEGCHPFITHWMPIPSFDEILEANRDVLERIKEKGD
ncbi:hypothetical protein NXW51_12060 [Bacteroides fragilis]|jgi:hypothetical protein|nr:hypothetical protein NXW51_12060 [Bacteroides fragilis]